MNQPLTLSKTEACEVLGISPAVFDDWRRRKILPKSIEGTRRWSSKAIQLAVEKGLESAARVDKGDLDEAELALREWENRQAS